MIVGVTMAVCAIMVECTPVMTTTILVSKTDKIIIVIDTIFKLILYFLKLTIHLGIYRKKLTRQALACVCPFEPPGEGQVMLSPKLLRGDRWMYAG